jgi:hypothetical protein
MLSTAAAFRVSTVALIALALSSAQEPNKKPEPAPVPKPGTPEDAERIRRDILGPWQLVRADMGGSVFAGTDCDGYLLVSDGFLAVETHMRLPAATLVSGSDVGFASGIYRWDYDATSLKLQTNALIGVHNDNPGLDVEFVQRGAQRTYDVMLAGSNLILQRDARSRFEFVRLGRLPYPR